MNRVKVITSVHTPWVVTLPPPQGPTALGNCEWNSFSFLGAFTKWDLGSHVLLSRPYPFHFT